MQQRISPTLVIDNSLAYIAGAVSVLVFGVAVFAIQAGNLGSLAFNDEVKVEAAQFPYQPKSEMDIFAGGCNSKAPKIPCKR